METMAYDGWIGDISRETGAISQIALTVHNGGTCSEWDRRVDETGGLTPICVCEGVHPFAIKSKYCDSLYCKS